MLGTEPLDILILSNGPGELITWVKPVVRALRHRFTTDTSRVRISVVLSPCANASGTEAAIAQSYPEVDRVQAAAHFFPFLLWGQTAQGWDWRRRGIVLFLGGDQIFPVIIGQRLGYRTVVYAEWEARWLAWIDRVAAMRPQILETIAPRFASKFAVVGDLMAEAVADDLAPTPLSPQDGPLIGLLPGSKPAKLSQGVPLALAIAQEIHAALPHSQFVLPVAPTLQLQDLARFADPEQNRVFWQVQGVRGTLVKDAESNSTYLQTPTGLRILLYVTQDDRGYHPPYALLRQCSLCLTTVGANTAELGALGVPMLVLLPTNQLDAMRAWDGIPGLLANLPAIGGLWAKLINTLALRRLGLLAWPNLWAGRQIVPELVGHLTPQGVAKTALSYLQQPEKLAEMRSALRQVRGQPGAADRIAQMVWDEMEEKSEVRSRKSEVSR